MRIVRAFEVGEYVFCHRAWWLRHVQGLKPQNVRALEAGTRAHARHGRLVGVTLVLRVLAVLLALAAVAALATSLLPGS